MWPGPVNSAPATYAWSGGLVRLYRSAVDKFERYTTSVVGQTDKNWKAVLVSPGNRERLIDLHQCSSAVVCGKDKTVDSIGVFHFESHSQCGASSL